MKYSYDKRWGNDGLLVPGRFGFCLLDKGNWKFLAFHSFGSGALAWL
jgi:hypothetical protein